MNRREPLDGLHFEKESPVDDEIDTMVTEAAGHDR